MTLTPQPYPLWLAQVVDNEVQAGRVIAWIIGELGASNPDASAVAQPLVVFGDDDGLVWATMPASRTAPRFMCDERSDAVRAAQRWVGMMTRRTRLDRTGPAEGQSPRSATVGPSQSGYPGPE